MTLAPMLLTLCIAMTPNHAGANDKSQAIKYSARAYYIQSGLDKNMREFEKRIVPKDLRIYGGWIANIVKMSLERRVTYEYSF